MLINPTIDMLRELGLYGMATAFQELDAQSEVRGLEHGEWLAMLLEREATMRRQKRFEARARAAKLRHDAQIENADFRAARGLDRNLFMARLPAATGSESTTVFLSLDQPASAKAGLPALSATRPAAKTSQSPTTGFPGCSPPSRLQEATGDTAGSSNLLPGPTC